MTTSLFKYAVITHFNRPFIRTDLACSPAENNLKFVSYLPEVDLSSVNCIAFAITTKDVDVVLCVLRASLSWTSGSSK